MQEPKFLQFYKMRRSISINGGEFYRVGQIAESFQEEDDELLVPKEREMTFDELYEHGGSDWYWCDTSVFKKKRLLRINQPGGYTQKVYTEKTLEKIVIKNTYYMVTPTMSKLMGWHNSDDVIRYMSERGLSIRK